MDLVFLDESEIMLLEKTMKIKKIEKLFNSALNFYLQIKDTKPNKEEIIEILSTDNSISWKKKQIRKNKTNLIFLMVKLAKALIIFDECGKKFKKEHKKYETEFNKKSKEFSNAFKQIEKKYHDDEENSKVIDSLLVSYLAKDTLKGLILKKL